MEKYYGNNEDLGLEPRSYTLPTLSLTNCANSRVINIKQTTNIIKETKTLMNLRARVFKPANRWQPRHHLLHVPETQIH